MNFEQIQKRKGRRDKKNEKSKLKSKFLFY